jgi:hypothetical protein
MVLFLLCVCDSNDAVAVAQELIQHDPGNYNIHLFFGPQRGKNFEVLRL